MSEIVGTTTGTQEEIIPVEADFSDILIGSGEYLIVGIRYYKGVAHPGEFVELIREPNNPYDRNAIRVDNMQGEKVGHIKATMASMLAPILDGSERLRIRIDGTIPRRGNSFTLPIFLEFYCNACNLTNREEVEQIAFNLKDIMKRDYRFHIAREFGGGGVTSNEVASVSVAAPTVSRTKLNWQQQEEALNKMFDRQLDDQYKDLPDVSMPTCLKGITLFDYQIKGVKWLLKKEMNPSTAPFYRQITENGKNMWFCDITNSSQSHAPNEIRGSILCDQMGLGKSIQTICLILLGPPVGVEYKVKNIEQREEKQIIPMPEDSLIRAANLSVLKAILKSARLAASGKKQDLVNRILKAKMDDEISGEHFPESMRPIQGNLCRCTLIVCPVSVMSNWTEQIENYVEEGVLSLRMFHGPNRYDLLPEIKCGHVDVLLVSYQTLAAEYSNIFGTDSKDAEEPQKKRSRRESIFDIDFHRIVLDEAHTIRNGKTKFFKGVKQIKADRKLAITGTPFVNRSDDVHSLLSFLGVQPLENKTIFTRAISTPIKNGDDLGLTRLRTCMGFVSLRRSKENVNMEIKMVEKDVQLCRVEFPQDLHKNVYDALFGTIKVAMEAILNEGDGSQALKHYSSIFEKLLRLRQACCSGTMISKQRRELAFKAWEEVKSTDGKRKLSAEEGLALLNKLKSTFTQDTEDLPECGICLTEMEVSDGTILKGCNHVFCKLCIRQVLLKSNRKCPYCRRDFDERDIVDMGAAESAANTKTCEGKDEKGAEFGLPPKIQAMLEAIKGMKKDEKGVIFSQFTSYLDLIGDALKVLGHKFVRIDGSVSAEKRISYIHKFNSDQEGSPRFILCSLLASGTGINLTRGNWAFMMDTWWNEAIENQAMDRIHRINQTRKVTVLRFVMKDSIEERIVALQETKSMQAKGVLQKLKGDEKRKALLSNLRGLLDIEERE